MYGQLAMTCFLLYQVYLYGSEAITYMNSILSVVTEGTLYESSNCPHPSTTGKDKTRMVEEPSHAKQISLTHV
jgi:hypothetical protein